MSCYHNWTYNNIIIIIWFILLDFFCRAYKWARGRCGLNKIILIATYLQFSYISRWSVTQNTQLQIKKSQKHKKNTKNTQLYHFIWKCVTYIWITHIVNFTNLFDIYLHHHLLLQLYCIGLIFAIINEMSSFHTPQSYGKLESHAF